MQRPTSRMLRLARGVCYHASSVLYTLLVRALNLSRTPAFVWTFLLDRLLHDGTLAPDGRALLFVKFSMWRPALGLETTQYCASDQEQTKPAVERQFCTSMPPRPCCYRIVDGHYGMNVNERNGVLCLGLRSSVEMTGKHSKVERSNFRLASLVNGPPGPRTCDCVIHDTWGQYVVHCTHPSQCI